MPIHVRPGEAEHPVVGTGQTDRNLWFPRQVSRTMNPSTITAIAAVCGSLVGASATIVTTWITHRAQRVHAERDAELRRHEDLYVEFITESSRLAIDALSHSLEGPDTFVKLYGILGRIRLVASDHVLAAAETCARQLVDLYARPNLTVEEIRMAIERDRLDPIRDFSVACREELIDIAVGRRVGP